MRQKDILLKRYFSDETRFADLINGVIGAGKSLITAEQVTEMDSQVGIIGMELPACINCWIRKGSRMSFSHLSMTITSIFYI